MPPEGTLEIWDSGNVSYWDTHVYYYHQPGGVADRKDFTIPTEAYLMGQHLTRSWRVTGPSVTMTEATGTTERVSADVDRTYRAMARLTRIVAWALHNQQASQA